MIVAGVVAKVMEAVVAGRDDWAASHPAGNPERGLLGVGDVQGCPGERQARRRDWRTGGCL